MYILGRKPVYSDFDNTKIYSTDLPRTNPYFLQILHKQHETYKAAGSGHFESGNCSIIIRGKLENIAISKFHSEKLYQAIS